MLSKSVLFRRRAVDLSKRYLSTTGLRESLLKYPVGQSIHGYTIENAREIPEFSLVAVQLKHSKTGSEHVHLDSPHDKNNVFLVAFKTNAPDATGVPHILEHTTLCGSHKYPVRDPFFKMLNRSLSNFMNAMTGHDYTFYPFATTNAKDFENLMDVYLSSTFEPLLTFEDFTQEGWRLENQETENKESSLAFKGVVYNEMKGQYSNSAYYYYIKFQEAIYASLNNSGGDPSKITDLSYEDLIEFHFKNYHPSNARTFTYGSFPLVDHLQKLNTFFNQFGRRQKNSVTKLPIFTQTSENTDVTVSGPVDSMSGKPIEEQYKTSITWNLGNPLDESKQYDIFKWKALSSLLFDGHSAPFYQELIETEYGDDFSVNSGLDSTTALLSFTIGMNNISLEKSNDLKAKITDIIKDKVLPRFSNPDKKFEDRVEAILHQIELNFKKHKPEFGLGLLSSLVPTWVNGMCPITMLLVEKILNEFKQEYAEKGLLMFKDLIENSLLNPDTQTFKFTMVPDEQFMTKLEVEEKERLHKKTNNLSSDDKEIIYERGLRLAEKQKTDEDVSVLPTLTLKDIPRQGDFYDLEFSSTDRHKIQKRVVDANGLVYVTAKKDISFLPSEYYKFLPLFTSCLTNLAGTTKTSVTDLETKIQKLTGGLLFSISPKTDPFNVSNTKLSFLMKGMSLGENSQHIYDLWNEILCETRFDDDEEVLDKLNILVKGLSQNQINVIADRGHSFASSLSNSKLSPTKFITEQLSGLAQVQFVLDLNANLEKNSKDYLAKSVLPILKDIRNLLLQNGHFEYSLVGSNKLLNENEKLIEKFDQKMISRPPVQNNLESLVASFKDQGLESSNTLIDLPFQVGYASLAKVGSSYVSKDGAALQVLAQILTFKHLHSVIRESNGAYGGGLTYDGLSGTLNYYSYRDPNPLVSVDSFKDSFEVALMKAADLNNEDLQEAKLSIFQSVDAPIHIASQGSNVFLEGITDEMRQKRRENFLDVGSQDLKNVVEKYLIENKCNIVTVIANKDKLNLKEAQNWNIKKMSVENPNHVNK
ncbi:uncharacterized protein PRCAT00004991001 [Priceomyces carsonii]|uniref:uncharacterized protein n=1 Tax=Priceomyces carsonii TaxID=28549 RepID=UPI002EDA14F3|nr:unnamed protein product [Priceomyces carsonii]